MRNSYWDSTILALEWQNNAPSENLVALGGVINRKKGWNMLVKASSLTALNGSPKPTLTSDYPILVSGAARCIWATTNTDTGASGVIGTGDFTFSTWIIPVFFSGSTTTNILQIGNAATGFVALRRTLAGDSIYYGTSASFSASACSTSLTLNTLHHYAIVRSGTTVKAYLNGNLVATFTSAVNISETFFWFGGDVQTTSSTQVCLSQITLMKSALWTTNFTPPDRFFEYSNTLACTLHETLPTSSFLAVGIEAETGLLCGFQTVTTAGTDTSFTFTHGASEHFYILVLPNERATTIVLNASYFVDNYGIGLNADGSRVIMQCTTSGTVATLPSTWPTTGSYNAGGAIFTYVRPYHPGQILGPFPRG